MTTAHSLIEPYDGAAPAITEEKKPTDERSNFTIYTGTSYVSYACKLFQFYTSTVEAFKYSTL